MLSDSSSSSEPTTCTRRWTCFAPVTRTLPSALPVSRSFATDRRRVQVVVSDENHESLSTSHTVLEDRQRFGILVERERRRCLVASVTERAWSRRRGADLGAPGDCHKVIEGIGRSLGVGDPPVARLRLVADELLDA